MSGEINRCATHRLSPHEVLWTAIDLAARRLEFFEFEFQTAQVCDDALVGCQLSLKAALHRREFGQIGRENFGVLILKFPQSRGRIGVASEEANPTDTLERDAIFVKARE